MTVVDTDRQIHGTGTPAGQWHGSPRWLAMPEVNAAQLIPAGCRLVVLAPHPDDEVLGTGGLLRLAARLGREVLVVAVTDGEASHPDSSRWPAHRLVLQRPIESANAVRALGLDPAVLVRLALPDGAIAARGDALLASLTAILGPADVVVAPWQLDGHPDHEAVGRIGQLGCEATGASYLQVPIWGWHWAHPAHPAFPWPRAVCVRLGAVAERKRRAVRAFVSQLEPDPSTGAEPILPGWALDRLVGDREVFLR